MGRLIHVDYMGCLADPPIELPLTNADRIRSMTDEELAEWRASGQCPSDRYHGDYDCVNMACEDCWLYWLREAAKE